MASKLSGIYVLAVLMTAVWPLAAARADFAHEYNNGVFFYKRAEYELAAQTFAKIVALYPRDPQLDAALYWAGQSHDQTGEFSKALDFYKRVPAEFPASTYRHDALYAAGVTSSHLFAYDDAAGYFSKVIDDPSAEPKTVLNSRVRLCETFLKSGDDRRAETLLRALLAQPGLGGERRQVAEFRLRQLLIRAGRPSEAQTMLARMSKNPDLVQAEESMRRGDAAFAEGRYGESRASYDQVHRRRSSVPPEFRAQAMYNSARSSMALGDADRALPLLRQVYDERDALPDARGGAALQLAYLYRVQGRTGDAEALASAGERLAEGASLPRLKEDLQFFRAESAYQGNRYEEAARRLAKMDESSYRVNLLQGRSLLGSGQTEEGTRLLEQAANQAPTEEARNESFYELARHYFEAKRYSETLTHLDRIQRPSDAMVSRILPMRARCQYELGRFGDAARSFSDMSKASSDAQQAKEYRYWSVLSDFKERNFSWAEKLMTQLESVGGVPGADDADPAAFLEAAMQLDRAIDFAAPGEEEALGRQLDERLSQYPHPRLYLFTMDRLYAKGQYGVLPRYAKDVVRRVSKDDEIYGRAVFYELKSHEQTGNHAGSARALKRLDEWTASGGRLPANMDEELEYLWAVVAAASGDTATARSAYETYLSRHPSGAYSNRALHQLGLLHTEARRPKEADLMGTLSDARGPKTEPARLYDLGRANVAAGKTQEGLPHLRSVIEHPESPADLRDSAADALISTLNRLQQYSTLESDYRRLSGRIRGRAIHSRAKHALGLWHFRSGRFPEAHAYLAGVQDPPGSDAVVEAATRTADCDYLGQRYEEALSGYTRVVRQYPQSRWAQESYYAAQLCKIKLGQTADALGGYERFLEQHPDAPQAPTVAFEAAKLYVQAEDLDAAERMLNYFEKKGPANLMEEAVRMRIAMAKRRGQHDRIVSLSRSHREAYGFNLEVAQDAAVSAAAWAAAAASPPAAASAAT